MEEKKLLSVIDSLVGGKISPQSRDVEENIIGCMLMEPKLVMDIKDILKPSDFYVEANQIICKCLYEISEECPVDMVLLIDYLLEIGKLDEVGGPYYISKTTNSVVSTANVIKYCRIVKQKSIKRSLIEFSLNILNKAYTDSDDVFDLLDESEEKLKGINFELNDLKITRNENIISNILNKFDTRIYNAKNNIVNVNDIFTRMPEWDKLNGPLFNGLYIIAGRPGMGKGVHMTELACRMAKEWPVGIINGEMTNEQAMTRIGCNLLNIDNYIFKKDPLHITEEEQNMVHNAMDAAMQLKIKFYDQRNINKISNRIKMWVERDGVKCILADFLTLFKPGDEMKFFSDTQRVNYCLEIFASLAKDVGVPIILYVQMNRDIEKRAGIKEPNLADLKQSGSIEEFAYQVSILHRPEYYDVNDKADALGENTEGLMYQIVLKHREGELDRLKYQAVLKSSKLNEWKSCTPSFGSIHKQAYRTVNKPESDSGKLFVVKGNKNNNGDFDEGIQTTEQF